MHVSSFRGSPGYFSAGEVFWNSLPLWGKSIILHKNLLTKKMQKRIEIKIIIK